MKLRSALATFALLLAFTIPAAAGGFDQYGYNRSARIFVGPASGWCLQRGAPANCLGVYSNDRLVMKWNAEWDRGNAADWDPAQGPYAAYLDNEWNGNVPDGSGTTEHVKIVWSGACLEGSTFDDGGYCIWGQFEAIFDKGVDLAGVRFATQARPAGYGAGR